MEDDTTTSNWRYFLRHIAHISCPKLQIAAIFWRPVLIEINEQVEAPVQAILGMLVEVCVNLQIAPYAGIMDTTPCHVRVGKQTGYTGDFLQQTNERVVIQLPVQPTINMRHQSLP